tara:strand:+ start:771 stop:1214 length:444 start_codon:yes stop_codon:yes gene_type:complete
MNIKDYEDYLIFEDGGVFSIKRNRFLKPRNNNGYLRLELWKNNTKKAFTIHRLVGLHYIPNPENKPQIDHIDRNKTNNNIDNLRWATHSENQINTIVNKHNKLREKNIKKNGNGFQVRITRNKLTYYKNKKTLEEAIVQRDIMLSMF